MTKKIATWVINYKWAITGILLIITLFFAYEIRNMVIRTEITDLYPPKHPFMKVHEKYKNMLGSPFKVLMMLKVKEGDIYHEETLDKISRINDALDAIKGVNHNKTRSIASFRMKKRHYSEFGVEITPLMHEAASDIEQFKKDIRTIPGVYGIWVSPDEKCVLFSAGFFEHSIDYDAIFQETNRIIEQESDSKHEIFAAGEPVLIGWVNVHQNKIYCIFAIIFSSFVLLLWLFFRNTLGVIVNILPLILGVIWFFGLAGLLNYNLEPLTLVIPIFIAARSMSHSVQFTRRYFEIYHECGKKDVEDACIKTMTRIAPPGLLSMVTDALGIILIAVAPIPMMQKLAYICGFWTFSNVLTGLLFPPLFISLYASWHPENIKPPVGMGKGITRELLSLFAKLGQGKAGAATFIATILLTTYAGYHAAGIEIGDTHPGSSLFLEDSQFNISVDQINRNFPGTEELFVIIEGQGERPVEDPGFLRVLNSFQRYMEKCPGEGSTFSVSDILPRVYRFVYDGHPKWETFPQNKFDGYNLFIRLTSNSAPGDYDFYFGRDWNYANVIVWYKDHMGKTLRNAIARVEEFIKKNKAILDREKCRIQLASGNLGVLAAVNETVEDSHLLIFILAMGGVFLLCATTYRSMNAAVILIIPLGISTIATLAVMRCLGIGLNINTLPIVSVGLGVGIDGGIYLLSRICEEYQTAGGEYSPSVTSRAIQTTGMTIFFTASTMIVGMILWYMLSSIKFQAEMGLLLALMLLINTFGALVLIPAMVNLFKPVFMGKASFFVLHQP